MHIHIYIVYKHIHICVYIYIYVYSRAADADDKGLRDADAGGGDCYFVHVMKLYSELPFAKRYALGVSFVSPPSNKLPKIAPFSASVLLWSRTSRNRRRFYIPQRGVQWKQDVVVYIML